MTDPAEVLDAYLFYDIWNNINPYENEYDITFSGNEFLLRDVKTGELTNLVIQIVSGSLSDKEIRQLIEDQEWEEEDDD